MVVWSALLFLMTVLTKLTYIALSVLAQAIAPWGVLPACLVLMVAGWFIFMNPVMPGPLVYAVTGMVIARKMCEVAGPIDECSTGTFLGGVGVGVLVSLITKVL